MARKLSLIFLIILNIAASAAGQDRKQIEWQADSVNYDVNIGQGAYRLIGNVRFDHEDVVMFCDSAYYYSKTNSLDAYHNIHINKSDTVHVYGEYMHYDGNTRIAQIWQNVKMEGQNTVLYSSRVEYDLGKNIGYYTHYADIESGENKLRSRLGSYNANNETYFFRDSVTLINPDYTMYSDTLSYHIRTGIAYFLGPTEILSDSGYIYCENGWYNTETNTSMLKDKAFVQNQSQQVTADSMYYERETGYGEAYSNIDLFDEEQNVILRGDRASFNQQEDRSLLTDSALFIYITDEDSIYVHADTLRAIPDTGGFRQFKAYHHVRLYKSNLQGKCDSLYYSTSDSVLRLYDEPVLWSGENQLSAEYIEIRTKNQQVDQLYMDQVAFIINREDSTKFNQIKGRNMTCFFRDNDLYKIETVGNGQTVYYAKDQEEIIGVNVAESSDLTVWFRDNTIDAITFFTNPVATLYPLELAPEEELILDDFSWHESIRPGKKEDVFR
ncbi:MAG: LPS export ABC transporter periplasmic protein LptC [Bacteroidales bacterium]|nr:LPS export ABC transporter periplasmic protein LptC [Bacteroidales bacterium]